MNPVQLVLSIAKVITLIFAIPFIAYLIRRFALKPIRDSKEALWATNLRADLSEDYIEALCQFGAEDLYTLRKREILDRAEELWQQTHLGKEYFRSTSD